LQARNAVADPYRLKPGSRIRMPLSRIPVVAATARAVFVRGQVSADGKPLRTGDALRETAQIQTGPDGSATLEFPDGTRVALPGGTRIEVRRLRTFARSGLTDTVIGVERGAASHASRPMARAWAVSRPCRARLATARAWRAMPADRMGDDAGRRRRRPYSTICRTAIFSWRSAPCRHSGLPDGTACNRSRSGAIRQRRSR
jgi:hypothetical protein